MSFWNDISNGLNAIVEVTGVQITYRRGSDEVEFKATPGKTTFQIVDGIDGAVTKYVSRDYLFPETSLVLNDEQTTPERGDKIVEQSGETIRTYEVMRPDGNEQVWKYTSSGQTQIRVHTQQVVTGDLS